MKEIEARVLKAPASPEIDMLQDLVAMLENRIIPDCHCFTENGMGFDKELGVHICRACGKSELVI